ncbi:hypothetical protein CHARACLAT_018147 [Characodon lateralis]|uniref:Uncharacterized protein n=1 Tax=Characodon lateralis TaxID=208331 RepID=A0ABU7E5K6_9TELE|nr:hypothetical protein [Characodon lateralis]
MATDSGPGSGCAGRSPSAEREPSLIHCNPGLVQDNAVGRVLETETLNRREKKDGLWPLPGSRRADQGKLADCLSHHKTGLFWIESNSPIGPFGHQVDLKCLLL